tara:strand:+ start:128 stop:574 length:447 start_codon:yes stop_codon:yes gene_type:complete
MSIVGYQSTPQPTRSLVKNTQTEMVIPANHLNPDMLHSPTRNVYALINKNIVIGKDIRLRSSSGRDEIAGWQVSLPAPLVKNPQGEYTGTLLSRKGKPFFYAIDDDGRVFLSGEYEDENDEVILNINPYVAELPLRFRPFPERRRERL